MVLNLMQNLVTKLILVTLGLLFVLPSAYKIYSYIAFRYNAISVDGVIVNASRGRDMGGRPIVEYKDLQGNSYERKSKAKTHWFFAPKVGAEIQVFYSKKDPNIAVVDSKFHYIILPLFFVSAGICFLIHVLKESMEGGSSHG